MDHRAELAKTFAPTGTLRASINLGNPILAHVDPATGLPSGVSVDLAREFARRLGMPIELAVTDTAGKSVKAVAEGRADFGFFAIDPIRGKDIAFTAPYVLIEGCYLVRDSSPLRSIDEVDQIGHRVAVGSGSAYDLFLTRELKHAEIVRAATSPTTVATFAAQHLEVAAGVRQQLQADALEMGGLRLLPGHFMVIQQAMGVPRTRGAAAADALCAFVEEVKASGFIAQALARHGVEGAAVAPAVTH